MASLRSTIKNMIEITDANRKEKKIIKRVEKAVFEVLEQEKFFSVDLSIVDEATIREFNGKTRGKAEVTDVLSFPYFDKLALPVEKGFFKPSNFDGKRVALGSIMICRERAEAQAQEYGHSYERELGFLTCHGLLHLLSFDHDTEDCEKFMNERQDKIMEKAGLKR